jgi:hypothetical protein
MLTVTIDPGVFAPPSGDPSENAVHEYVDTLLHWKTVLDGGLAKLLTPRATTDVLVKCDLYPFRPRLREILSKTNMPEYDSNTVAIVAGEMLRRVRDLENASGITDALVSPDSRFWPDILEPNTPGLLRVEVEKCLLVLAITRYVSTDCSTQSQSLATRLADNCHQVEIDAMVEILEHRREDLGVIPLAPRRFTGAAPVCSSFQDYLMNLDKVKLWRCAHNESELELAIKVAIYQDRLQRKIETRWTKLPGFKINANFLTTASGCGALAADALARSTIRSIVETIDDLQLADIHALNTGPGPNDAQQKRGKDLAWRRDVTYEHHLHYWHCEGGTKELSCMVPHNSFHIFF